MNNGGEVAAKSLVPPRPNLGPEPWPEPAWPVSPLLIGVLIASLFVGAILLAWRRRKRRHGVALENLQAETTDPETALESMMRWHERIRNRLVDRLGPSLAAMTTEEIERDSRVREAFGDQADALFSFLRATDLCKFSGAEPEPGLDWGPWVDQFLGNSESNSKESPRSLQRSRKHAQASR